MPRNLDGKCLVTGGTGFVGQRLVENFIRLDRPVRLLARDPHPSIETIICDFVKDKIPDDALDSVETLFHLAGFAHDLRDASGIEHLYRKVNVETTLRLAEMAVDSGVKRFVFVSSVKAGGYDEDDLETRPEGVYGQTKRDAELKVLEIGLQSGMHVSIVRPSLVYGPRVKGNLALMHRGIKQGWFPPLPETGNRRSLIHVDDLVRALILVAEDERANGEIFIATDGVPHSSREIYEALCIAACKNIPAWSVPKFFFDWVSFISPKIRYKIVKLMGDEYYSSKKLEGLGFRAENNLKDITVSNIFK
jgi:UDP-glucose 4-epimerase